MSKTERRYLCARQLIRSPEMVLYGSHEFKLMEGKYNPFCPKKRENLFVMLTTATFKHERAGIDRKEASKQ